MTSDYCRRIRISKREIANALIELRTGSREAGFSSSQSFRG
jgi:hypothetical protein